MSELDGRQASTLQPPSTEDSEAWKAYWKAQDQPWRTEPEIDKERQEELAEHRTITPDIEKRIYPFKDMKLSRADIEWLLATNESGGKIGPVDWSDESQREREGLDVRGADLRQVDLSNLPLARLCGGQPKYEWHTLMGEHAMYTVPERLRTMIATFLIQANLIGVHLEGVNLTGAHLEGAYLCDAHLEGAYLGNTYLEGTELAWAHLKGVDLTWARLIRADLTGADLEAADLDNTIFVLAGEKQGIGPKLAEVHWGETNLAAVDWSQVKKLGEEYEAQQPKTSRGKVKGKVVRLSEYQTAVRANRQLAVALQVKGLNEVAARFAFRAQKLQRVVFRRQRKFGQYLFSGFLDLLAGYGYRPGRSVVWYFVIIFWFALAYFAFGHLPLLPDALVFSLTSFHGRGFFPGLGNETSLHNPLVVLAATEAVIGLFIEISFIATFTRRFFGS